ncbi:MarR family winged helix-turn-helix transcriptional regulator [Streptomyces sp. NPDC001443]
MVEPSASAGPSAAEAGAGELLPTELRTWMQVLGVAGSVEQQLRKHVKEALGVTHDEFLVLCLLADQPENALRMSRVAELLGRPKTRLTYQVACLQHAGLVARESVSDDRRGVALVLTGKARRLLAEKSPALASAVAEAVARVIGPAQSEALTRLLVQAVPPGELNA